MSADHNSKPPSYKLLGFGTIAGYGSGDYALNMFWQGVNFYLLFYYTDVLGLPNSTAGLVVALGGIWDAITDPIMGIIAERTRTRFGAYRPYLLYGSIPLAASFILVFHAPAMLEGTALAIFAAVALVLFKTCYTIVSIPYSTLGAKLTSDSRMRIRISGVRMYFGFMGGVSVILIADFFGLASEASAFFNMALVCGLLSIAVLVNCFIQTGNHHIKLEPTTVTSTMLETIKAIVRNKAFLLIMLGIMCVTVAVTTINATTLYVFVQSPDGLTYGNRAIFILAAAPLITIPLWSWIALRIGKRKSWILGSIISLAGLGLLYGIPIDGNVIFKLFAYCVITLGFSSYAVLFWSMLPDTVEYGEYVTGVRNESSIFGLASSGQKLSLAGTAFMIGALLDNVGYVAGAAPSDSTAEGLLLIATVGPMAAIFISMVVILFYPVSARSHIQATNEIEARHKAQAPNLQELE